MRINRFGVYATDEISILPEEYDTGGGRSPWQDGRAAMREVSKKRVAKFWCPRTMA
jgi:hypothetical protein